MYISHFSIHFHIFLYIFHTFRYIFPSLTTTQWVVVSIFRYNLTTSKRGLGGNCPWNKHASSLSLYILSDSDQQSRYIVLAQASKMIAFIPFYAINCILCTNKANSTPFLQWIRWHMIHTGLPLCSKAIRVPNNGFPGIWKKYEIS